jgi:hypothetical protein
MTVSATTADGRARELSARSSGDTGTTDRSHNKAISRLRTVTMKRLGVPNGQCYTLWLT